MSSAKARKASETHSSVEYVQMDGLVVLKIIKHCQEEGTGVMDVAQGVLLGLVTDSNRLEITTCFPFPRHTDDEDFDEMDYQMEMARHLRQLNMDHLYAGFYQSAHFGSYFNKPLFESQFNYQNSIPDSVVVIYDPLRTSRGFVSLKAFRLTNVAMEMYKDNDFSTDALKNLHISFESLFEEIPIIIKNSHLMNTLMCEVMDAIPEEKGAQFLDMSTASVLEKNLQAMMDCIDTVSQEGSKLANYQRQLLKQQQAKHQFQQRRIQENAARAAKGEPPLPEEDINKLFKPSPPPSRLESLLLSGQIGSYCKQLSQFSTQHIGKLFMIEALQDKSLNV